MSNEANTCRLYVLPDVLAQSLGVGVARLRTVYDVREAWKEKQNKVEQNQLFFYYKAGQQLAKTL